MRHAVRAELTKTLTLRSVQVTLLATLVLPPALAVASGLAFDPDGAVAAVFPIESHGFETTGFGQPLIILLAALVTGSEYLDGQLRSTLLATPNRGVLLAAKLLVLVVLCALIGLISTVAAVFLKHAVLGISGLSPTSSRSEWAGICSA